MLTGVLFCEITQAGLAPQMRASHAPSPPRAGRRQPRPGLRASRGPAPVRVPRLPAAVAPDPSPGSGAARWHACWAHGPAVRGSGPRCAAFRAGVRRGSPDLVDGMYRRFLILAYHPGPAESEPSGRAGASGWPILQAPWWLARTCSPRPHPLATLQAPLFSLAHQPSCRETGGGHQVAFDMLSQKKFRHRDSSPGRSGEGRVS